MKQYYLSFSLDSNCIIKYEVYKIYAATPSDAIRKIEFSPLYNVSIKDLLTGNTITYDKIVNIVDKEETNKK